MRRIIEVFEERLVAQLKAVLTQDEQDEVDYDLALTPYPAQQPDGSMGLNMGVTVSLSTRSTVITDHVLVSGMVADPFATDPVLALNVKELLAGLRARKAESAKLSNGGLFVPGQVG